MRKLMYVAGIMILCLLGCEGTTDPQADGQQSDDLSGNITLYAEKPVIEADGKYVSRLTVLLMDRSGVEHDVTADVEIYCNNEPVTDPEFKTTEAGDYEFYAMRGFDISNTVTVRAVKGTPALPSDSDETSVAFPHRMMLVQHTGSECPNCPAMMDILKQLSGEEEYNQLYYHVASHSYNSSDAAYSSAAASLSKELDVHSYPWLTFNLTKDQAYRIGDIKNKIDEYTRDVADAGISAAAAVVGNSVYVNVGIKSAVDSKYRIAVWLLEDNVRQVQSGASASWHNMHDNCLRGMAGSTKNENIYGRNVGMVEAGKSYECIATIDGLDEDWKMENCEVLVLVVSGNGTYDLVNCAVCPVGGTVSYEYVK